MADSNTNFSSLVPAGLLAQVRASVAGEESPEDKEFKAQLAERFELVDVGKEKQTELDGITRDIEKNSKALSGAPNMPRPMKVHVYKDDELNAKNITRLDGKRAVLLSSGAMEQYTHDEKHAVLAHEQAHALINANPELKKTLTPPNLDKMEAEMDRMHLNPKQREVYMNEAYADHLAEKLGAKPEALISANKKMEDATPGIREKDEQKMLAEYEKDFGMPLSEDTKKTLLQEHRNKAAKQTRDNAHPSHEVRSEAIRMEAEAMKEKPRAMNIEIRLDKGSEYMGMQDVPNAKQPEQNKGMQRSRDTAHRA